MPPPASGHEKQIGGKVCHNPAPRASPYLCSNRLDPSATLGARPKTKPQMARTWASSRACPECNPRGWPRPSPDGAIPATLPRLREVGLPEGFEGSESQPQAAFPGGPSPPHWTPLTSSHKVGPCIGTVRGATFLQRKIRDTKCGAHALKKRTKSIKCESAMQAPARA